jgi:hypothetical protein
LTDRVLPFCSDDQLLAELTVIATVGWQLPTKPRRRSGVRQLLLLADPGEALTFRQAAARLLNMIDDALLSAVDDEDGLSYDESTGLRILLGVHPRYRTESSPTVRRVQAAEYLAPQLRRSVDAAATFLRRHQPQALLQVLARLRQQYGQASAPGLRDVDVLSLRRWYRVGANRQVVLFGSAERSRLRADGLAVYEFVEARHSADEGFVSSDFRLLTNPLTPGLALDEIADLSTQPGNRLVRVRLPEGSMAGDEIGLTWEESVEFNGKAPPWTSYFVSAEAPNEGFELTVEVTFAEDCELPVSVWWYQSLPATNDLFLAMSDERRLSFRSRSRTVSHTWAATDTERRVGYGIQWAWPDG